MSLNRFQAQPKWETSDEITRTVFGLFRIAPSVNIGYHNLSDGQFEELVIELCVAILGNGVQGFGPGKDGGRDARFVGKAKLIPSEAEPWNGTIVIQAKHTGMLNKAFSESDFSGDGDTSILAKEIPRIKAMIQDDELQYYMLFANRRLTAVTDAEIRRKIAAATGLDREHIRLYGTNELDRLVKRFPVDAERADLNPAKSPADIDPHDLAEVITKLAQYKEELSDLMEGAEPPPEHAVPPKDKNKNTGLGEAYFKKHIRPMMVEFGAIGSFLGHPDNQPYVRLYENTASELEARLDAWTDPEVPYERLLETLIDRLFQRDFDLRKNKRLTRAVVYYMYCHCDIGKEAK